MLYYNRLDLSEVTDVAKSINSKRCLICHYLFFNHGFKFQDSVCNSWHDLTILCLNITNFVIVTVKGVDYHCIIHDITRSNPTYLSENSVFKNCGYI